MRGSHGVSSSGCRHPAHAGEIPGADGYGGDCSTPPLPGPNRDEGRASAVFPGVGGREGLLDGGREVAAQHVGEARPVEDGAHARADGDPDRPQVGGGAVVGHGLGALPPHLGERAVDVFYVTDLTGTRVVQPDRIQSIREAAKGRPWVHLVDWYGASKDHPEYFIDGVHPTLAAMPVYISLVQKASKA